jgi:hypothetical protein
VRDANITREAYRDDGPDYPVQRGLTFPAIVLVACLIGAVVLLGGAYVIAHIVRELTTPWQ